MLYLPSSVGTDAVHDAKTVAVRRAAEWRRQRGFTFPEVLAGVGILATLLAMSTPLLSRMTDYIALRGASQTVLMKLQRVRQAAVTENRRQRWELSDDHTYVVSRYDVTTDTWQTTETIDLRRDSRLIRIATTAPIIFAANGSAPSPGVVTLTSPAANTLTVSVNASGNVSINR